mmetsp:Transcript_40687/g.90462  ORF Transcript_40687/g.90462 Transcript_40687/m.90462 type:complete len:83 (+) Transcript_40687:392-640(+)
MTEVTTINVHALSLPEPHRCNHSTNPDADIIQWTQSTHGDYGLPAAAAVDGADGALAFLAGGGGVPLSDTGAGVPAVGLRFR